MHTADLAPSRISSGELALWRREFVRLFIFKQKTIWKVLRKRQWQIFLFFLQSSVDFVGDSGNHSRRFRKPRCDSFFCLSFSQLRDFMFPAKKKTHMEKVPLKDVVAVARGGNYGSHCWFKPCHLVQLKDL